MIRHSYCTLGYEKNINEFFINRTAGHAKMDMTRRYTHMNTKKNSEMYQDFGKSQLMDINIIFTTKLSNRFPWHHLPFNNLFPSFSIFFYIHIKSHLLSWYYFIKWMWLHSMRTSIDAYKVNTQFSKIKIGVCFLRTYSDKSINYLEDSIITSLKFKFSSNPLDI